MPEQMGYRLAQALLKVAPPGDINRGPGRFCLQGSWDMRLLRFIHEEMIKPLSNVEAAEEQIKSDPSAEQESVEEKEAKTKLEE
jgi:hypothetical protein